MRGSFSALGRRLRSLLEQIPYVEVEYLERWPVQLYLGGLMVLLTFASVVGAYSVLGLGLLAGGTGGVMLYGGAKMDNDSRLWMGQTTVGIAVAAWVTGELHLQYIVGESLLSGVPESPYAIAVVAAAAVWTFAAICILPFAAYAVRNYFHTSPQDLVEDRFDEP